MIAAISSKFDHRPLTSVLSKRAKAEPAGTTGQGGTPAAPPFKKIFKKKKKNLNVFSYLNVVIKGKKKLRATLELSTSIYYYNVKKEKLLQ